MEIYFKIQTLSVNILCSQWYGKLKHFQRVILYMTQPLT